MKINTLVLAKYATPEAFSNILKKTEVPTNAITKVIIKREDYALVSELLVCHERHMMGDVCDLLWESANLDPKTPLLIASTSGYLKKQALNKFDVDIGIFCDEATYAGFHFDEDNRLVESGELIGKKAFCLYFSRTQDFVDVAKKIIVARKSTDGMYQLSTVVNQCILDGLSIVVQPFEE